MTQSQTKSYSLGETAAADENPHLLGQRREHMDIDYSSTARVKPPLSSNLIIAIWVKNDSGGVLTARSAVEWKSGYFGTRIGAATGAGEIVAGVVDPYVGSSGVANGRHFWLIIEGPAELISDGNAAISQNEYVKSAATGKIRKTDTTATAASELLATFAQAMESVTNVDGTTFRAWINIH